MVRHGDVVVVRLLLGLDVLRKGYKWDRNVILLISFDQNILWHWILDADNLFKQISWYITWNFYILVPISKSNKIRIVTPNWLQVSWLTSKMILLLLSVSLIYPSSSSSAPDAKYSTPLATPSYPSAYPVISPYTYKVSTFRTCQVVISWYKRHKFKKWTF